MSVVGKAFLFQFILFVLGSANAQECDRLGTVHIAFGFFESEYLEKFVTRESTNLKEFVYDFGRGSEVFVAKMPPEILSSTEVSLMKFFTPFELRKMESKIIRCEIEKGKRDQSIYVDININSVFKNIVLVEKRDGHFYQYNVRWNDSIE